MMQSPLFSQDYRTPINLLPAIFRRQVHRSRHRNPPIRTNITTTTHPTNLRSVTAREMVDRTRGLTILWSETTPITMYLLLHISTPYPSRPRGLRDLYLSKRRAFLVARIGDIIIIIRGSAPRRTWVVIDLRGMLLCTTCSTIETGSGTDRLYRSMFQSLARNRFQVASPLRHLQGIGGTQTQTRVRISRLS
jgi:hypothetical protein